MSIEPYAVINTMERCGSRLLISFSRSRPLRSGRLTSSNNKSKGCSPNFASPDSPVPALETPYPSPLRRSSSPSRISDSSSTTRIEPLDMNRFPDRRQLYVKRSSFTRSRPHVNLPRMFFNNSIAHRQPQSGSAPARLGSEKWVEYPVNILAPNALPGVDNFHFHTSIVRRGTHFQHSSAGHRIARI